MQSLPALKARMASITISNLAVPIRSRFRRLGGVDLELPARGAAPVDPWKP